ncbi:MAG: hypothetical protein Q8Q15_03785, partial [bacterium]|nr:hypothetical protein [bacterium]
ARHDVPSRAKGVLFCEASASELVNFSHEKPLSNAYPVLLTWFYTLRKLKFNKSCSNTCYLMSYFTFYVLA